MCGLILPQQIVCIFFHIPEHQFFVRFFLLVHRMVILIMSGGQGPGEDIPESQAMAAYAIGKGVGREKIITEEKSVSTQENLLVSASPSVPLKTADFPGLIQTFLL